MRYFKIYGEKYELRETSSVAADGYAVKNALTDDMPKGKFLGYVTMSDGSVIECYKKFNWLLVVLPVLLILAGVGAYSAYLMLQPKDVVNTKPDGSTLPVKTGVDNNVVSYNGFQSIRDNRLLVNFQNGDYPAIIWVDGEGIESEHVTVGPGEFVADIPVTFSTTSGVATCTMYITTDTSSQEQAVVIEIPDNSTPDSPTGLEGYWQGETIYGIQ